MLKLTDPLLTRAESKAISVFRLIVLEPELVLELGAPCASLHSDANSPKANYVPFVQEPNFSAIEAAVGSDLRATVEGWSA